MATELTCKSCNATSAFEPDEIVDDKAECPKCGSTIRIEGEDKLSETMHFNIDE